MTERDMLEDYVKARREKEELEEKLKTAESTLFQVEDRLINALLDKRAKSTANYEGLGRFTILDPTIQAYYDKEFQDQVFSFVEQEGRDDMIKTTIHHTAFSGFIKSLLQNGRTPPAIVGYHFKESVRFNKWKETKKGENDGTNN